MPNERHSAAAPLRSLVRFFLVYGLALVALFWVLPAAALLLQDVYDGLGAVVRLALLAGLVAVAAAWQLGFIRNLLPVRRRSLNEIIE